MKQYFVVADVHSFFDEMIEGLTEAGFDRDDPEHIFVCLGDLLDRGSKPLECLNFVNSLPKERKILVRGNHEDLLEICLSTEQFLPRDYHNGTQETVARLCGLTYDEFGQGDIHSHFATVRNHPALIQYLSDLEDYAEVGEYVFVHGWIPCKLQTQEDWREGDWKQARWLNGMEAWSRGDRLEGKTIVCGHWHTSWGHAFLHNHGTEFGEGADFSPFVDQGILAIDACTAYSRKVNCVKLISAE